MFSHKRWSFMCICFWNWNVSCSCSLGAIVHLLSVSASFAQQLVPLHICNEGRLCSYFLSADTKIALRLQVAPVLVRLPSERNCTKAPCHEERQRSCKLAPHDPCLRNKRNHLYSFKAYIWPTLKKRTPPLSFTATRKCCCLLCVLEFWWDAIFTCWSFQF